MPGMLGTYSLPPTSKKTPSYQPQHASRHVHHARALMHVGISNPRWQGKRSRHSRRMHNQQFCVSVKRLMAKKRRLLETLRDTRQDNDTFSYNSFFILLMRFLSPFHSANGISMNEIQERVCVPVIYIIQFDIYKDSICWNKCFFVRKGNIVNQVIINHVLGWVDIVNHFAKYKAHTRIRIWTT